MATLLIAEHDNAQIKDATNKALTAALALGADVDVLVAGENAKGAAVKANDHLMNATRYLAVSGTNIAELAPGYLAHTGHRPGVKADYDPFQ